MSLNSNGDGGSWTSQVLAWLADHGGYTLVEGTPEDDQLLGGDGNDVLVGGRGDDRLDGAAGQYNVVDFSAVERRLVVDLAAGTAKGDGNDSLVNIAGVIGGSRSDLIRGDAADNLLEGGNGNDHVFGEGGDDVIYGGSGNDKLVAGAGADYMDGGQGNDNIAAGDGDNEVYGGTGNDKIVSGAGADLIEGGEGNDNLAAGAGDNQIHAGSGNDKLTAGAGDDLLDGGSGIDNMSGGSGDDTYYVDRAGDLVKERLGEGNDTIVASISYSLKNLPNVENLTLSDAAANPDINGSGNQAANVLLGNSGDNQLAGLGGNDTLVGGEGADMLGGGAGNDIFVFDNLAVGGFDTITDFTSGSDLLQLDASVFTALAGGISADNLLVAPAAASLDADDYLLFDTATGALSYDADASGAGAAVQIAAIGVPSLSAADFSLG